MPDEQQTQTYYAKSMFTDPIMILNIALLALQLDEVRTLVPLGIAPYVTAGIAVGNLVLRFAQAVRPVALIAPGAVKPVEVRALTPKP